MLIRKVMHPQWLSNSYLVADSPGGHGVLVDTGADVAPLLAEAKRSGTRITHIINTHRHPDHVAHNRHARDATGAPILAHEADAEAIGEVDREVSHDDEVESGTLRIRVLHIPGHTAGQIALVVNGKSLFTGDTLFRHSIGGCLGPGHTTFADLRHSLMEVLFRLPHEVSVYPGHTVATRIGEEWDYNPFIRIMRGVDPEGTTPCLLGGSDGTLILRAADYDGGTKAWVRLPDGTDLIAPGSQVVSP